MERRTFLTNAGQAAAFTAASASKIVGANDRVLVGMIGCGGRARYVCRMMREAPNVEFVAVADPWKTKAEAAREWAGPAAKSFGDFRNLLEIKEIDAVMVGTPDHWHCIPTILACQAGKDVYVEKPLAHNIREGRAMVEAARRYKRLVQTGTQHRSAPHFPEVAKIIQSGQLGEVRYVRVWNFSNMTPNGIGRVPDAPVPDDVDWDMYLGPAPKVPFNAKRLGPSYRWFSDYAGGYITDFGTHRFDTVHQIMGADAPSAVSASGGRFAINDAGDMPTLMQVTYEYPNFVLSYEACNISAHGLGGRSPGMKYYNSRGEFDRPHGQAYYGANGAIFADRIGYEIFPDRGRIERKYTNVPDATPLHAKKFIECVRSRETPPGEIEVGHRSSIIPHLGNIALKVGKKLKWDAAKEEFPGEAEANKLLGRKARKPWDLV